VITVIVEHLEPCINKWIYSEYSFVANLFRGRTVFSNVSKEKHAKVLSRLGRVVRESVTEWLRDRDDVLVLDPDANEMLTPRDLENHRYIVIGGIMGSHPRESRTRKFISSKMPRASKRSLGPRQFTIAGAAYVLKKVEEGRELNEIPIVVGLRISRKLGKFIEHEIELPYAFPLDERGNPVLPPNYIDIVSEYVATYETRVLSSSESCYDDVD